MGRKVKSVMGVQAGAPRITGTAVRIAVTRYALPLLVSLVAFDVVIWWLADRLFGVCAAIWCWF